MTRNIRTLWLLTLVFSLACHRSTATPEQGHTESASPPPLTLSKERKDLLFSYLDAEGKFHDVDSADKVPAGRRQQVLVRDLSKRAEELRADQFVYVADLTREENGAWPYAVMSRYRTDGSIRRGDFASVDDQSADAEQSQVVLYGTSWCGACQQAREYFRTRGIKFVDKDVEKDDRAAAQMAQKLRRAGLQMGGVPVIDIGGKIVLGFDARQIDRLLKGM